MSRSLPIIIIAIALFVFAGCSGGGGNATAPEYGGVSSQESPQQHHVLWGYWQGIIDPVAKDIEFVPLRNAEFHLNALVFLEPPPFVFLSLESLEFNGDIIEAGIGIRHPFLGLTEFTGFDVCGIFISNGSVSGFSDASLVMAGEGDTRLLNPDGYSRWWNPAEFPADGSMLGYKDGLLGTPDSNADYNSTVNGYKYFCDDLELPDSPMSEVTLERRGMFGAGMKNVRHYTIELGAAGLVFNYAVDASWEFPQGNFPWTAPDDFGPNANRSEAWRIEVREIENTLWNDGAVSGGDLSLEIDVYDWFNAELNTVRAESPGNFAMVESALPPGGGDGYSTYQVEITDATPAEGEIELLISIISEKADFEGFIPGTNTAAYFIYAASVGTEAPVAFDIEWGDEIYISAAIPDDQEHSPALAQETDGQVRLVWVGMRSNGSHDMSAFSINGTSWVKGNCFGCSGGCNPQDRVKVMTDLEGDSYMICPRTTYNFLCDCDRNLVSGHSNYTHGIIMSSPDMEFGRDKDAYLITWTNWAAEGPGILQRKGPVPNRICAGGSIDWSAIPTTTVVNQGSISHVRSWGLDSIGNLYLVYYDTIDNAIEIAVSNDDGISWNAPVTVFSEPTFTSIMHPSIDIDDSDVLHVSFTRHSLAWGDYELCYTKSTDGGANWSDPIVADSSATEIEDAHVQHTDAFDLDVVIICYEAEDEIRVVWSEDAVEFTEPIVICDATPCIDPDMIVLTSSSILPYDIVAAWAYLDGADRDIHYKLGNFVNS